jgi:hypothetical protein
MIDDDWVMGALAAQDYYQPTTADPWKKLDDAQLERRIVPDSGMAFGTTTPQEEVYVAPRKAEAAIGALVPQSPLEWSLAGLGPIGKVAGKAGKIGALAAGAYGELTGEAEAGPLGKIANAIKAYHSSPHTFDKFDISRIGTGEGAQVYGHGLYFAENPAVSGQGGQYWNDFRHRFSGNEGKAAELLQQHGFDRNKALKVLNEEIEQAKALPTDRMFNEVAKQSHIDQLLARQRLLESDKPVGPRTYEVDIKADPKHMLDWDKKFTAPELEKFAAKFDAVSPPTRNLLEEWAYRNQQRGMPLPAGEDIVRELKGVGTNAKNFSRTLNEAGIPGIKYLDEGSRTLPRQIQASQQVLANPRLVGAHDASVAKLAELETKRPTSNYVIFDPKIIDIRKMYGVGGLGAGLGAAYGMGDIARQDQYGERL